MTTPHTSGPCVGRTVFLVLCGLMLSGLLAVNTYSQQGGSRQNRPNILFICSDQHAFKYAGFAGHPIVQTPNLDKLASAGTVFRAAYAGAPVCVPSRASMMTGMYASDVGSYGNSTVWDGRYPVWATYFQKQGYATRAYGKLDLDDTLPMGFENERNEGGHKHKPDITSLFRMPLGYRVDERRLVDGESRNSPGNDARTTEYAEKFLTGEAKTLHQPWLLYLGYNAPHPPFIALKKYFDLYYPDNVDMPHVSPDELEHLSLVYQRLRHFKMIATPVSDERIRRARAGYYGHITELDAEIGKVLQYLKVSGQYDRTIIIYTADHGESLGEHGLWLKNNLYDCAIRIPLIVAGPDIPSNKAVNTPVSQIDLTPTMLQHGGIGLPSYLRGQSLDRFFHGSGASDNVVYAENHSEGNCTGSFMIRKGHWKYIYFSYYDDLLFNLQDDPGETKNLAGNAEYSGVLQSLKQELLKRVDPEKITADAFKKQKAFLNDMVQHNSEAQLVDILKGRLGEGQAQIMAERLKGKF